MEFEWEDTKASNNLRKHRIDFVDAKRVFDDWFALHEEDRSADYGEVRMRAIGIVNGVVLTIIYTERDDRVRLISARRATSHEQRLYDRNRIG